MAERDVVITTSGPSMLPYWPQMAQQWDLAFTEKPTADGAKKGMFQGAMWVGDYMPKTQDIAMFQCVAGAISEINWPNAYGKFRWKAEKREDLTKLVWETVNNWAELWLGDKPHEGISLIEAIRYNLLQHVYLAVQQYGEWWECDAENWLAGYLMKCLTLIVPAVMALDSLLTQRHVVGMVVHEDVSNECNFYVQWAKYRGVPSIHVAHGGYGTLEPIPDEEANIHLYLAADHVCVWNEAQRAFYLRGNAKPEQVHLTGHGKADDWAKMKVDREFAKQMIGADPAKPAVLYVGSWVNRLTAGIQGEKQIDDAFEMFLEGCKELPDWTVLVRPHPGVHKWLAPWHKEMMAKHKVSGAIIDGDLSVAVQAADVIMAPFSSTLDKEAAIINRPSVTWREQIFTRWPDFYVACEPNSQSMADGIRKARGREHTEQWQEARNRTLYDEFYIVDGHSTERGLSVIRQAILKGQQEVSDKSAQNGESVLS